MPNPTLTAICPYYERESKHSITCEGICPAETIHNSFKFDEEADKKRWVERYCSTYGYRDCPYARMLENLKYPEARVI